MIPTIGRIVHYTNLGDKEGKYPPETQAAIITGVQLRAYGDQRNAIIGSKKEGDYIVDLHIFYRTGEFDMKDVPFSEAPERGHWNWPPKV